MRQRLRGGLVGAMLLLTFSACKVEDSDNNNDDDNGGSSGSAGSAGGNNAGSAGQPVNEGDCGDVPASGRCVNGNRAVEYCRLAPVGSNDPPTKKQISCEAFEVCGSTPDGSAACVLDQTAGIVCRPGDTLCDGDTLRTCSQDGKSFADTNCADAGQSCRTPPKQLAQCVDFASAGGSGTPHLTGAVSFERRGMSQTGPTGITVDPAWLDFVAIYNEDRYIGSAITDTEGKFDAELTEPADANTLVYVFAMDFDAATQQPLVAIVHNDDRNIETQNSSDYWFWRNDQYQGSGEGVITADGTNATMTPFTIREADGAGALRIFQWIRYGMLRLDDPAQLTFSPGLDSTKGKRQQTVAVFWEPGVDSICGACYLGPQGGGATVTPEGTSTVDHFDTLMQISGSSGNPTQWSYSVLSHETGHWVMSNYSRSPGEGGQHFVGQASKPGLAWSEGWATAYGQWNSSDPAAGDYDPLYFDTQDGTTFWVNVATASFTAGALQTPDPEGPIDQFVNENVVSSMLWHLWQPEGARFFAETDEPSGLDKGTYQGIGDDNVFRAVQSDRIVGGTNRGYSRIDLIDFYDAAICEQVANDDNIDSVSADVGYPWDQNPSCP
jgi:hypothetical protein